MLRHALVVFAATAACVASAPASTSTHSVNSSVVTGDAGEVTETQHTTCVVTTDELVAKAQATVTRVLSGMCHAKEIDKRFSSLATDIMQQAQAIKNMLQNIEEQLRGNSNSADTWLTHTGLLNPRDEEIERYNGSLQNNTNRQSFFTYYWKVDNIMNKLRNWNIKESIRSPSFYISAGSYRMFLNFFPNKKSNLAFISVSITKGEHDANLPWPFKFGIRISILDKQSIHLAQDIESNILNPGHFCDPADWKKSREDESYNCLGFEVQHAILESRQYLLGDNIIFKCNIFM